MIPLSGSEELLLLLHDLLLCHLLVYVIENLISLRLVAYPIHIHIHSLKLLLLLFLTEVRPISELEELLLLLLDFLVCHLLVL